MNWWFVSVCITQLTKNASPGDHRRYLLRQYRLGVRCEGGDEVGSDFFISISSERIEVRTSNTLFIHLKWWILVMQIFFDGLLYLAFLVTINYNFYIKVVSIHYLTAYPVKNYFTALLCLAHGSYIISLSKLKFCQHLINCSSHIHLINCSSHIFVYSFVVVV